MCTKMEAVEAGHAAGCSRSGKVGRPSTENLQCGAHTDDGPVRITSAESQDKSSTGTEQTQGRILATMENLDGLR